MKINLALMGRQRRNRTFKLDEVILEGLNTLARQNNSSTNRLVENILYKTLKDEGLLEISLQPLGETRGKQSQDGN